MTTDWLRFVRRMIELDPGFAAAEQRGVITVAAQRRSPTHDGMIETATRQISTAVLDAAKAPEDIVRDLVSSLRVAMGGRP